MNETYREGLLRRCKAAYAANNIPWDPVLRLQSSATLERMTEHWERRAAGTDLRVVIPVGPLRQAAEQASADVNRPERAGSKRFKAGQRKYHGESYET